MHASGCTDRLLSPFEDHLLPTYGFGLTNLVGRATARADELADEEVIAGARILEQKVEAFRIELVAILGVTAYRTAYEQPKAKLGEQPSTIAGARVLVLPNPSGLNAHYQLPQLTEQFRSLRVDNTL